MKKRKSKARRFDLYGLKGEDLKALLALRRRCPDDHWRRLLKWADWYDSILRDPDEEDRKTPNDIFSEWEQAERELRAHDYQMSQLRSDVQKKRREREIQEHMQELEKRHQGEQQPSSLLKLLAARQ